VSLRAAGIRIDLDDFGTGYSSLGRLAKLPLDALKIDRLFVSAMATDTKHEAIVRATIALGHDLGLEVVAEGVEDRETWELLLALGCDTAQGYHIARPMPFADVSPWSDSWQAGLASIRTAGIGGTLLAPEAPSILVVERDPSIREIVRGILDREHYRVLAAATGAEALRIVERDGPKLMLLDVNVPIVGGSELVERLRAKHPPVAVVVMAAGPSAARWAEKLGAQGFLAKPFDIQTLVDLTAKFAR
jgi:CheY-like chemotaxis protein